ncbi:MAG: hypothetical protein KBD16_02835 [Candidatus Pacebacteria bacterium]|nr:hypothetical protein [Candidatus Paceibacterota bacterium]
MPLFKLEVLTGISRESIEVEAASLLDACDKAGLGKYGRHNLIAFERDGVQTQVAGGNTNQRCGCWNYMEEGRSCHHDLAEVGLDYEPDEPVSCMCTTKAPDQ